MDVGGGKEENKITQQIESNFNLFIWDWIMNQNLCDPQTQLQQQQYFLMISVQNVLKLEYNLNVFSVTHPSKGLQV